VSRKGREGVPVPGGGGCSSPANDSTKMTDKELGNLAYGGSHEEKASATGRATNRGEEMTYAFRPRFRVRCRIGPHIGPTPAQHAEVETRKNIFLFYEFLSLANGLVVQWKNDTVGRYRSGFKSWCSHLFLGFTGVMR
jgi:hypothetical protein